MMLEDHGIRALDYCPLHEAAPEMYEALKALVSILADHDEAFYNQHIEAFNLGMDAINKAEGKERGK